VTGAGTKVPAGPARFGSALIAATLLLRGDAAILTPRDEARQPPAPGKRGLYTLSELPAPVFASEPPGATRPQGQPPATRGALLASTSLRPVPAGLEGAGSGLPREAPPQIRRVSELPEVRFANVGGETAAGPHLASPAVAESGADPPEAALGVSAQQDADHGGGPADPAPDALARDLPGLSQPEPVPIARGEGSLWEAASPAGATLPEMVPAGSEGEASDEREGPVPRDPAAAIAGQDAQSAPPPEAGAVPTIAAEQGRFADESDAPAPTEAAPLLPEPAFGKDTSGPAPLSAARSARNPAEMSGPIAASSRNSPPKSDSAAPGAPQSSEPAPVRLAAADLPAPLFGRLADESGPAVHRVPDQPAAIMPAVRDAAKTGGIAAGPPAGSAVSAQPAAASLVSGPGRNTYPVADGADAFGYDDELILQISVAGVPGDDTVIAYGTRGGIYLPLGELARLLDLAISISDDGHFASGWFIDEKRTISVDLRRRIAIVAGREIPISRQDAAAFDGELYLLAERFSDFFPLTMTPDLRDQAVHINTLEPFPSQERLAREAERARLENRGRGEMRRWPRQETPWRALSLPMIDVEARAVSDSALGTRGETDLRLSADLAWLTTQAYLGVTTRDGLVSAHIEMGRRDPDADLLGPLRATEFQVGDIATTQLPMGLRGIAGRGLAITNAPLESVSLFDKLDLRGNLPAGYEVELYRNDVLLGSTREAIDGQYEFAQVPLDYGLNVLRLVFYGPQGQRSEEVRRISVGDGRLAAGQAVYAFGVAQKDRNLLGVTGPRFRPGRDYARWRASAEVAYGISSGLTGSLAGAWFDTDQGRRRMASASLRTGLLGMAAKLDFGLQDKGAMAVGAGLGGKLLGTAVRLEHVEYKGDFFDEVKTFTGDRLKRATEFDFNANLDLGSFTLPVSGRARRLAYRDGRTQFNAALRSSLRLSGFVASNSLEYLRSTAPGSPVSQQLVGTFDLATLSRSRLQARASLGYRVLPGAKLTSASIEADYSADENTQMHGSLSRSFEQDETQFGLSAVRRLGPVSLAVDGNYALRSKTYAAALRLGFSFGRNPLSGSIYLAESGSALSGAVAVRAFRDRDGDGVFGAGDEVLPGVAFSGGARAVETDGNGIALIGSLGSGTRTSIQVDTATLPDIAYAPVTRGIEVVPRPGRVHAADFAIQELSEVEGTAYFADGSGSRGVSGLRLQLVDARGEVFRSRRTESDGFFLFDQVCPGKYRIALEPDQAARLGIVLADPQPVVIGPEADVVRLRLSVTRALEPAAN